MSASDVPTNLENELQELKEQLSKRQAILEAIARELADRVAENNELQRTLDLIHDADRRAIKMWQDAHRGSDLIWPDRGKMIFWLLEQLEVKK